MIFIFHVKGIIKFKNKQNYYDVPYYSVLCVMEKNKTVSYKLLIIKKN